MHDEENNASITLDINALPPRRRQFAKKALYINQTERKAFCCEDFRHISKSNYRQYIHKLRPYLEVVSNSHPTLYKFKGIELSGDSHRITQKPTGDMPEFEHLLASLRDQPPMIHDIHLKFKSDLHSKLVSLGLSVNPANHAIENVKYASLDNNTNTKILIYPKTTQIIIGCTHKPIIYDASGVLSLLSHLAQVQLHLSQLTKHEARIPEVKTWIVTRYDFNKDGLMLVGAQPFWYEFGDVATGLIRFYSKKMPKGQTTARLEQIRTPHRTIQQELEELLTK